MGTPHRPVHSLSDRRSRRLDRSGSALAGSAGQQGSMLWTKGIVLHAIVIAGLFLMPGGCPPPEDPDDTDTASLAVTVTGQGSVALDPAGGTYDLNATVTLTATPSDGWTFDHWEGGLTGNTNPDAVFVDADKQVTAVFVQIGNNAGVCTEWTQTDITANTTIPAGCWLVNDSINVHNNATLTISPGATLKFAQGCYLWVSADGALTANGTSGGVILLTGQTLSPGWWTGVRFQDSNSPNNVLQYTVIECAGANYGGIQACLYSSGTSRISVSHTTMHLSAGLGFDFRDHPNITFDSNVSTENAAGAGQVEPWLVGMLPPATNSTYTGNTVNAVFVRSGGTTVEQVWSNLGVDYVLNGSLTVNEHTTLAAGIRLIFGAGDYIWVSSAGSLTASGTVGSPVVLTGSTHSPGWWTGVRFDSSNSPDNLLQYTTIEYGGANYGGVTANLFLTGTSAASAQNCTIRNSLGWGIWVRSPATLAESGTAYTGNASGTRYNQP